MQLLEEFHCRLPVPIDQLLVVATSSTVFWCDGMSSRLPALVTVFSSGDTLDTVLVGPLGVHGVSVNWVSLQ